MRKIGIACFTEHGAQLAERLGQMLCSSDDALREGGCEIIFYKKNLRQWCEQCFTCTDAIIFIGACGIAVRTIAPFLRSKTTDPAVLVIDENGQFVISLLSGHIGGANELADRVAQGIGAVPVITTASDVNGKIAVDVFAKKNGLAIGSMQDAKRIAAAILRGEKVGVYCSGKIEGELPPELIYLPEQSRRHAETDSLTNLSDAASRSDASESSSAFAENSVVSHLIWISEREPDPAKIKSCLSGRDGTVLHLIPKSVILGLGCRRGKPECEIAAAAEHVLKACDISKKAVMLAASIDLKKEEQGIRALCDSYGIQFITYTAEALSRVEGDFQSSEFVKKTAGVDNVCERAALLAAGRGGRLIHGKYAKNGVTAALALRQWSVRFS